MTTEEQHQLEAERDNIKLKLAELKAKKNAYLKNQSPPSLTKEILHFERRLSEIRGLLRVSSDDIELSINNMKSLIKETFGVSFYTNFMSEIKRRRENLPAIKLSVDIERSQECIEENKSLRKLLIDYNKQLTDIRKALNNYINSKTPELNKADFLKDISELNRSVPPIIAIQAERLKHKY